jgi:hypothetical protein
MRKGSSIATTKASAVSWPTKLKAAPIGNAGLREAERPIAASLIAIWCRSPGSDVGSLLDRPRSARFNPLGIQNRNFGRRVFREIPPPGRGGWGGGGVGPLSVASAFALSAWPARCSSASPPPSRPPAALQALALRPACSIATCAAGRALRVAPGKRTSNLSLVLTDCLPQSQ